MVAARLAEQLGTKLKSHKSGCLIAEGRLGEEPAAVAVTTTYMNESGRPVRQLASFYKTGPDRMIVVHDELDVPFGQVRVKVGGGTAGHNGLKSVANHLSSKDFIRIRFGIGRPRGADAAGYVLERFSGSERKDLPDLIEQAADAVEAVISSGPETAMNEFNTRERG
jgi:PTH1 family peptidyl-tRNA hydrolase